MKLQHLTIIFVIIIIPISLIVGEYIHSQINTINLQTSYSSKLQTATYDAMQALKLNTINSKYSTVSDSKLRDVEASISTFYKSLGNEIKLNTYTREELTEYTPAILYTMFDGYYIYSKYYNESSKQYEYGLKPYIYYTCRYKKGSIDIIVNYTLDNYITIYGYIQEGNYTTKSGHVINPDDISDITYKNGKLESLKYCGVKIEKEILSEKIIYIEVDNNEVSKAKKEEKEYVIYDNNKVYYDGEDKFFTINSNNKKQYINDEKVKADLRKKVSGGHFYSDSALKYYEEAYKFSKDTLKTYLSKITQKDAVDVVTGAPITDFSIVTGNNDYIFDCSGFNKYGNTEITGSIFDLNRLAVIRKSIKDNLLVAISNYNDLSSNTSYEYVLPVLNEEDWYSITNNISMVAFMQGIPIGTKYFNNYSVVTNNENKELVNLNTLLAITSNGDVHLLNCKEIIDGKKEVVKVYKNIDFERQTVVVTNNDQVYYYPHENTRCYSCIVDAAETYDIDYVKGTVKAYDYMTESYILKTNADSTTLNTLRKQVLTALARERYDLYKINDYFKGYEETIGTDSIPIKNEDDDFTENIKLVSCDWNENTHMATVKFKKKDGVSEKLKLQYQINASDTNLSNNSQWRTDGTYNNENNISIGEYPLGTKIYLRLFDGTYDGDYLVYKINDFINPIAPTINITNGTIGEAGYYISDVEVTITREKNADKESGFDRLEYIVTGAYSLSNNGSPIKTTEEKIVLNIPSDGNTTIQAWTYDKAGNIGTAIPLTINKDATAPNKPTIEILGETLGASGYYTTNNVRAKFRYGANNNETSGIKGLYYRIRGITSTQGPVNDGYEIAINNDGVIVIEAWMQDKAGNQSIIETKTINKDTAKPSILSNIEASDITTNSFKLNVSVKDEVSGIDKIVWYYRKSGQSNYTNITTNCSGEKNQITKSIQIEELKAGSKYYAYAKIYDKAGNEKKTSTITIITLNVEKIPKAYYTPESWTNGNVTVTLPTKVGFITQYQTGNSVNINGTWKEYDNTITISNNTTVYFRYNDGTNAGEYNSLTISNIDKKAPGATTITYNSGSNECKWQNNINISLSANDTGGSGVSYYEIDKNDDDEADITTLANFIPEKNHNSHNNRFRAVDAAGNKGAWSNKIEIHMDTDKPSVPVVTLKIANPATNDTGGIEGEYISGTKTDRKVVHIYSSTDAGGSGIAYYQYSHDGVNPSPVKITDPDNNQIKSWYQNEEGKWNFYVRAVDNAGNVSDWTNLFVVWIDRTPAFSYQEFAYTETIQEFTVPISGNYKLEVWGAQGGNTALQGGKGGYSVGTRYFEKDTKLYIVVGGKGGNKGNAYGGYNGGGTGGNATDDNWSSSGGGGGATHIGYANALLKNTDRTKVLIVAGGGGGSGVNRGGNDYTCYGGAGGGLKGENGTGVAPGQGGTQTNGGPKANNSAGQPTYGVEGEFGQGASSNDGGYGAGGGGGWFGGSSGGNYNGSMAGGGGSGYIGAVYDGNTISGNNSGNGKAKIEFIGTTTTPQPYMTPFVVYDYGGNGNDYVSFTPKINRGEFSSGIWYNYGYFSDETTLTLNYNGYDRATIEFEFGGDSFGPWYESNVNWGKTYINGTQIYSSKDQYPKVTYTLSNYTSNTITLKAEGENINNVWHVLTYIKIKKITFYKD